MLIYVIMCSMKNHLHVGILAAALFATAVCVQTEERVMGTFTTDTTANDIWALFRWSNESHTYKPYQRHYGRVEIAKTGTGLMTPFSGVLSRESVVESIDDANGLSISIALVEKSGFMQFVYTVSITDGGVVRLSETTVSDIILIRGTREDYLAGGTIEFMLPLGSFWEIDEKFILLKAQEQNARLEAFWSELSVSSTVDAFEIGESFYSADREKMTMHMSRLRTKITTKLTLEAMP